MQAAAVASVATAWKATARSASRQPALAEFSTQMIPEQDQTEGSAYPQAAEAPREAGKV